VLDNRAVGPADFDAFSFVSPVDARLPDGGGQLISDVYDVTPAKFGAVDDYYTRANQFGKQIENWHGVDVTFNARLRNGVTIQGGTSTGRMLNDTCDVVPNIDSPSRRFCRIEEPFRTQVRGLATYTVPRIDLQVSGTWSSTPGPELLAPYDVPNAVVAPSLGRNLSGGSRNIQVELVSPGTLYGDRINTVDFRLAKVLRFGRTRTQVGIDLFNSFNTAVPTAYNNGYVPGGAWLTPTAILAARWIKANAQFDF
jgi:hypothetical protein